MPPRKVYSREFKLETLRLLKSSGKTKADLERELGLYPGRSTCGRERSIRKGETWSRPSQAQDIRAMRRLK
jgi:transposase-like protein